MRVLEGLDPKGVFSIFEDICQIPHGSGNTDALGDWLVDFAKSRGLKCEKDQIGNVTIIKEATEGYESVEPVTLQAHMDMVCEKTPNCTKDMAKEGLDLAVDGDIVYAEETSLGGDDGIGVAIILALMDDASLKHPKLQGIFTVEEETGLYGAEAYDMERVSGSRFINLDSEEEGIMSISSAGGVNVNAEIPVARLASSAKTWRIDLKDLTGGHSGMEINKGLGNANKLMATLLNKLIKIEDTKLIAVEGGSFDNVISPSAYAIIACDREEEMRSACEEYLKFFKHKYKADPNMKLLISQVDKTENPMDDDSALRIISFLESSPNGVQMMTPGFPDLPQTSLNLGVVRTKSDKVEFIF
ncbi:MAG: beta-Ala-His dipeptidase, partial [Bacillota bacterium]|nr:beta-Ala-His dipeptidase [Bacillota bacterium]